MNFDPKAEFLYNREDFLDSDALNAETTIMNAGGVDWDDLERIYNSGADHAISAIAELLKDEFELDDHITMGEVLRFVENLKPKEEEE